MNLNEFSSLITNSTEILGIGVAFVVMLFTGIQAIVLLKTLSLAQQYLPQHENKLNIEREHRFAEKMIELVYLIDRSMNEFFDIKILESEEWEEEVEKIIEFTDDFTLSGHTEIRDFYLRHLAVKANKKLVWGKIISLHNELKYYSGFFDDHDIQRHRARMLFMSKSLIDWIVDTFPKLMEEKKYDEEFINYFYQSIVPIFPDTIYVQSPKVKNYEKYRDNLTELLFKILKKKPR